MIKKNLIKKMQVQDNMRDKKQNMLDKFDKC